MRWMYAAVLFRWKGPGGCHTLGAKYRHAKLLAELAVAADREKVGSCVNVDHGHIKPLGMKNRWSCGSKLSVRVLPLGVRRDGFYGVPVLGDLPVVDSVEVVIRRGATS